MWTSSRPSSRSRRTWWRWTRAASTRSSSPCRPTTTTAPPSTGTSAATNCSPGTRWVLGGLNRLLQTLRLIVFICNYASPSSGEAYRDRRLTTNFELRVEIFCVPTCFHMRIPKPCLSVCPYPEKRYHLSFVNISPTLVIDASMERSSRVLHHGNPKIWFFSQKSSKLNSTCILTCAEELKSFK